MLTLAKFKYFMFSDPGTKTLFALLLITEGDIQSMELEQELVYKTKSKNTKL